MTTTFYYLPFSHFSAKVRIVLAEKNIVAESIDIRSLSDTPYQSINPNGKVPYIESGDLKLDESEVINEWLNEQYPAPPLLPTDPGARARARLANRVHDLYIAPALSQLFTELNAEAPDQERVGNAADTIAYRLQQVESQLQHSPYFFGEAFSLVDACYAMSLWYTYWLFDQLSMSDKLSDLHRVDAWFKALLERDSIDTVLRECQQALGLDKAA